jgi:hypothetical protein
MVLHNNGPSLENRPRKNKLHLQPWYSKLHTNLFVWLCKFIYNGIDYY